MRPRSGSSGKKVGAEKALEFNGEYSGILGALFLGDIDRLDAEMKLRFLRGLRRAGLSGSMPYSGSEVRGEPPSGRPGMRFAEAFRRGALLAPAYIALMARKETAIIYIINIETFNIMYKLGARRVSREEIAVVGAVLESIGLASMRTDFKLTACKVGGGMLSTKVVPIFTCPSCGSTDIFRTELLYHKLCGYVGERFKYEDQAVKTGAAGGLACPSCGRSIENPNEYEVVSTVYHCEACGATFSKPQIKFYCFGGSDRDRFVDMDNLYYVSYPTLSLSRLGLELYESGIIEGGMILKALSERGYKVTATTNTDIYEVALENRIEGEKKFGLLRADFPEMGAIRWPLAALVVRRSGGRPGVSLGFIAFDGVGGGRAEDIGQEVLFSANRFYRVVGLAEGLRGLVYVLLVHEEGLLGRVAEEVHNKLRILMGGPYLSSGALGGATHERGSGSQQGLRVVVKTVEAREGEIGGEAGAAVSVRTVYEYPRSSPGQAPEGSRELAGGATGVYVIVADLGAEDVVKASEAVADVVEEVLAAGSGAS